MGIIFHHCWRGALLVFLLLLPLGAQAQERHALIFGNNRYSVNEGSTMNLKTAVSDANRMTDLLEDNKWNIATKRLNADNDASEMWRLIENLSTSPGSDILLFFSGHGWARGNDYFLVGAQPDHATIDDDYSSSADLRTGSLSLSEIIVILERLNPRRIIVIIDACSDQSFRQMAGNTTPSLDFSRFETKEILVLYSSSPGGVAYDSLKLWNRSDDNPNSVFTRHFLDQIQTAPTLLEAFIRTRIRVENVTSQPTTRNVPRQIPTVLHDTIDGSFSLLESDPISPVREAISEPESAGSVSLWRTDPTQCATAQIALTEALAERGTDAWRNSSTSAPARACIRAAALARMGVSELKYNVDGNGMVTFTEATSGNGLVGAGETVERLVIKYKDVARPEVKPRPSMSEFLEVLEEFAFRDDILLNSMIAGGGAGPRPLPLEFGESG